MDVMSRIHGLIRGGPANSQPAAVHINSERELLTAQGLPPYTEMSRRGLGYQVMNTSALAALVVRPSTVAGLTLWNGEPDGGKTYVIDRLFAFNLVSTAAEARSGMWAAIHPIGMAKPTADITAIKSMSGRAGYGGAAIVDTGATVVDDGWFPVGPFSTVEPTGVLPGAIMEFKAEGRFLVPPRAGISIQVVSSVVGNTFTHGFAWYEVQLPVE